MMQISLLTLSGAMTKGIPIWKKQESIFQISWEWNLFLFLNPVSHQSRRINTWWSGLSIKKSIFLYRNLIYHFDKSLYFEKNLNTVTVYFPLMMSDIVTYLRKYIFIPPENRYLSKWQNFRLLIKKQYQIECQPDKALKDNCFMFSLFFLSNISSILMNTLNLFINRRCL